MKKNVMMRVAAILMVCVLATTCGISGTFAKYVTTASGNDNARVAKWGFGTTSISIDMFDGNYDNGAVDAEANVVAPGTTKTTTITLIPQGQGAPEVAYTFNANISYEGSEDLMAELVWSLNDEEVGTFADLQDAINELYDEDYEAGSLPVASFSITWEWVFENGTGDELTASDRVDTDLGNTTANIVVTIDFTATQKNT